MKMLALALLLLPLPVSAGGLRVDNAVVPVAPPMAMTHAAYFSVTNQDDVIRHLVEVSATGYAMSHMHRSDTVDGVATMGVVDAVGIAPGQTVVFTPGGLHVMLMKPSKPLKTGDKVDLTLTFANGQIITAAATVIPIGDMYAPGS